MINRTSSASSSSDGTRPRTAALAALASAAFASAAFASAAPKASRLSIDTRYEQRPPWPMCLGPRVQRGSFSHCPTTAAFGSSASATAGRRESASSRCTAPSSVESTEAVAASAARVPARMPGARERGAGLEEEAAALECSAAAGAAADGWGGCRDTAVTAWEGGRPLAAAPTAAPSTLLAGPLSRKLPLCLPHFRSVGRGVRSMSALAEVTQAYTRSTVALLTARPVISSYHGASTPQPPE